MHTQKPYTSATIPFQSHFGNKSQFLESCLLGSMVTSCCLIRSETIWLFFSDIYCWQSHDIIPQTNGLGRNIFDIKSAIGNASMLLLVIINSWHMNMLKQINVIYADNTSFSNLQFGQAATTKFLCNFFSTILSNEKGNILDKQMKRHNKLQALIILSIDLPSSKYATSY